MVRKQVGGSHYEKYEIQPIEYLFAIGVGEGHCIGSIIKYLTRFRDKGGREDLRKAKQYLEFLIEHEEEKEDGDDTD